MTDPQQPMALIEFGSGSAAVLNVDDAVKLFHMLCGAEMVQYDWALQSFKRVEYSRGSEVSLKRFAVEEYAKLALNSTN